MSNQSNTILLSTAYLPDLAYLSAVLNADSIYIENHEYFIKQTFRNRCSILTSNGKQLLSIPLLKQADKELIKDKRISYSENWQQQHWRTITSSYKNSPYFEFFEDDLKPFYTNRFDLLIDYNTELLKIILHILRKQKIIVTTAEYIKIIENRIDLRDAAFQIKHHNVYQKNYYQVFEDKFNFTSELSCLDALFNVGLETIDLAMNYEL